MNDDCPDCILYKIRRGPRIRAEIAKTSTGREAARRWTEYMAGVHRRHLSQPDPLRFVRTAGRFAALMSLATTDDDQPRKRGKRP